MIPGVSRTWRNNSESHGEKVTLLSSFSHLFLFHSLQRRKSQVRSGLIKCSVTLVDPPLFPRIQQDLSNSSWKNLIMLSLHFLFVAAMTLSNGTGCFPLMILMCVLKCFLSKEIWFKMLCKWSIDDMWL